MKDARHRAILAALLCVQAGTAAAQLPAVSPGLRVRIESSATPDRITGTLLAQRADSLDVVRQNPDRGSKWNSGSGVRVMVSTADVRSLAVSAGRNRRSGVITWGLLCGLSWGLFAYIQSGGSSEITVPHTLAAAALGGALGNAFAREKWVSVFPPSQPTRRQ